MRYVLREKEHQKKKNLFSIVMLIVIILGILNLLNNRYKQITYKNINIRNQDFRLREEIEI